MNTQPPTHNNGEPAPHGNAVGAIATPGLNAREHEVLLTWLRSDNKAQVGRQLYISPGTVNTHIARIRAKYDAVGWPAPTKGSLLARALQDGLLTLDEFDSPTTRTEVVAASTVDSLIEMSSLGTPDALEYRGTVTDEQVDRVLGLAVAIEKVPGIIGPDGDAGSIEAI